MPLSASLLVPWASQLVGTLVPGVGLTPVPGGLPADWTRVWMAGEDLRGLVLKTSRAELPRWGLDLGLERTLFAAVL